MLECAVTDELGIPWVHARGRIDSMTSPQIQQQLNDLIQKGGRLIVADLGEVKYISSAGLRVFLAVQKQLRKAGGEIVLFALPEPVVRVFESANLLAFFRVASSREEIGADAAGGEPTIAETIDGIAFEVVRHQAALGRLERVGSQEKLAQAAYTDRDVTTVSPGRFRFGTGLAASGDSFDDYKNLFGESLVTDHSLFFYPAVKRSAVDFMLFSEGVSEIEYRFLHGFGFDGSFRTLASFEGVEGFIRLDALVPALFNLSDAPLLGIVFLAESKGVWGMHLKKVPIAENRPQNGKAIFDSANFAEWISFPVEPADINHIVLGVGVAARERETAGPAVQSILPRESSFHVHGAVFSKEPLSRRIDRFEPELRRVAAELDVLKVQHLLGQSVFGSGIVGIIELGG